MSLLEKLKNNNDENDISIQGRIIRDLVSDFNRNDFIKSRFVNNQRGLSDFEKPYRYPDNFIVTQYDTGNFKMELLKDKSSSNGYVVLQLHGGGYVGAFKNHYRKFAGLYSEVSKGAEVLSLDYRVAPEHPFPAALQDGLYAFDWLIQNGYSEDKIIFAGDSAGGGLALSICHYLSDRDRQLPAGLVLMSPWTDLTGGGSSYKDNYDIDPVFGGTKDSLIYNNPYIGHYNPKNPYISPIFGDFTGFPPMLVQVGSHEMLLSDSVDMAEKAKLQGVRTRLSVYDGMFHVFQLGATVMPESRRAWAEIGRFFDQLI